MEYKVTVVMIAREDLEDKEEQIIMKNSGMNMYFINKQLEN